MMKSCRDCGVEKPLGAFYREKRNADGRDSYCGDCRKARHAAWVEKNRERVNEYQRVLYSSSEKFNASRKANSVKRYSVVRGASAYRITRREMEMLKSSPCRMCGTTEQIEIDHIVPISRGGRHSIGNLQALCKKDNRDKGTRFWAEFRLVDRKA